MDKKIKETLEKQLQLLSERSENPRERDNLAEITNSMIALAQYLTSLSDG